MQLMDGQGENEEGVWGFLRARLGKEPLERKKQNGQCP